MINNGGNGGITLVTMMALIGIFVMRSQFNCSISIERCFFVVHNGMEHKTNDWNAFHDFYKVVVF